MSVVIRFEGLVGRATVANPVPVGSYLKSYDPEAQDGRGLAVWTPRRSEALVLGDFSVASDLWRAVPKCRPTREDGRPNRPLSAFSITIEHLREEPNA